MQTRMKIAWRTESRRVGWGAVNDVFFFFFQFDGRFSQRAPFSIIPVPPGSSFCVLCVSMSYFKNVSLQ